MSEQKAKTKSGVTRSRFNALVRFFEALGIVCLIFLLPMLYLIQGLIELKDMIVEGEHYLPNGRGRN